jgi:hypothetical protein
MIESNLHTNTKQITCWNSHPTPPTPQSIKYPTLRFQPCTICAPSAANTKYIITQIAQILAYVADVIVIVFLLVEIRLFGHSTDDVHGGRILRIPISGCGGLGVSMLASGSNPVKVVGFFRLKNPKHAFLWRGSKAVGPMSQICGMLKNPILTWESPIVGKIDRSFLAHSSTFHW